MNRDPYDPTAYRTSGSIIRGFLKRMVGIKPPQVSPVPNNIEDYPRGVNFMSSDTQPRSKYLFGYEGHSPENREEFVKWRYEVRAFAQTLTQDGKPFSEDRLVRDITSNTHPLRSSAKK
jgi:hypothetical protein